MVFLCFLSGTSSDPEHSPCYSTVFALNGVDWEPGPYADTIPHLVFVAFQMMYWLIWTYPSMERMHIRHSMDLTDKSPFPVNVNYGVKEKINM